MDEDTGKKLRNVQELVLRALCKCHFRPVSCTMATYPRALECSRLNRVHLSASEERIEVLCQVEVRSLVHVAALSALSLLFPLLSGTSHTLALIPHVVECPVSIH